MRAAFLGPLLAPGFLANGPVRGALLVGAVVAVVSGTVGVFTVMRGQSFAGHSLGDVGATGAAGAFLLGVGALWGFLGAGLAAGAAMEGIGSRRPRERDLATGIVLSATLGVAALLLYLDTVVSSTSGAPMTILFGSLFVISPALIPPMALLGGLALALLLVIYRPLLLASLSPELARARGVSVRLVGLLFMATLVVAVEQSAVTIGALLSTALLIGPAATALRLSKRPGAAVALAALLGLLATWTGIVLGYDSFYWPPRGRGWPVSFFVVALVLLLYLLSGLASRLRRPASQAADALEDAR